MDAVLGSCPRSLRSVRSGLNAFIAFVGVCVCTDTLLIHTVLAMCVCVFADECEPGAGKYFPPSLDALLAWSRLFRSVLLRLRCWDGADAVGNKVQWDVGQLSGLRKDWLHASEGVNRGWCLCDVVYDGLSCPLAGFRAPSHW